MSLARDFEDLSREQVDFLDELADVYLDEELDELEREKVYGMLEKTYPGSSTAKKFFRPDQVGFCVSRIKHLQDPARSSFKNRNLVLDEGDDVKMGARQKAGAITDFMTEQGVIKDNGVGPGYSLDVDDEDLDVFYHASVLDFAYRWEEALHYSQNSRDEMIEKVETGEALIDRRRRGNVKKIGSTTEEAPYLYTTARDNELQILLKAGEHEPERTPF